MFNTQNSAYGRGITSNLVSEEQRQRYNSGGRVRLAEGTPGYGWQDFVESPIGKPLVHEIPGAVADMFYTPINVASRLFGYNPGLSARKDIRAQKDKWFGEDREGRMTDEEVERSNFLGIPFSAKTGYTSDRRRKAEENLEEKPDDDVIDLKVTEKVDPISDTLDWTPQEKKEKIGQIQLKLAQRLVGGARDKWGSKAQMKNIGDAFGDVAAIGDKTELRKDDRKYKAMAKAYKAIDRDKLASAKEYGNQIAGGATESQALKVSTNGKLRSTQLPRNKKQRDKVVDTLVAGDIYFDEGASTNHFFVAGHEDKDGKGIPVPKDQLEEIQDIVIKRVG